MPTTSTSSVKRLELVHAIKRATFLVRAALIEILTAKAGYRPDQPRAPAGTEIGGQWILEDGDVTLVGHDYNPKQLPEIPEERPPTIRERNSIAVRVAIILSRASLGNSLINIAAWVREHAEDRIVAYLDSPKFLDELQRGADTPKPGYDVHHIVEQTPARRDGFSEELINGWKNKVRIPTYRHWQITQWYATPQEKIGNLTPRQYLEGRTWQQRYQYGLKILRQFEVLK